jgi:hypothetical protein
LSDGTVDTTHTSLTLIGKDYAGYGQFLNENFVYLLENFANTASPANPMTGQLWWDKTNNILKVWSGASWKISTGATSSPYSAPPGDLSALGGDLWFDTTNQQLKVYSGSSWVTVGPQATSVLQTTGAFAATISDTLSASHKVIQLQFNGVVYAIFAYETFTTTIPGFTTIKAGINFNSTSSPSWVINGPNGMDTNATNNTIAQRDNTGGITATAFNAPGGSVTAATVTATSTINGTFNGPLNGVVNSPSVTATTVTAQSVSAVSGFSGPINTASQTNITSVGTLTGLSVNGVTALTGTATLNGTAIATVGGSTSFTSINNTVIGNVVPSSATFTTANVLTSLTPGSNLVVNLGTGTNFWNGMYSNTATVVGSVTSGSINTGSATIGGTALANNFVFANGQSVVGATLGAVASTVTNIPNSALQNSTFVINGVTISLGGTSTVTAAAGTLSGTTLASGVTASSLTSVGTLSGLTVSGTSSLAKVSVTGGGTGAGSSSALNVSGDITASRSASTGVVYFGTGGAGISFDGTNFTVNGGSIVPNVNNTYNIGTSGLKYNTVYATTFNGTATSAQYADLAERYASDAEYPTGTVVELGGEKEITVAAHALSDRVFGVISTNPAYLMNRDAGTDVTHPPVALAGRVPVRVIGAIAKGDRLVSAGNGLARKGMPAEITTWNVIGRALENKEDLNEGVIEAVVTIK